MPKYQPMHINPQADDKPTDASSEKEEKQEPQKIAIEGLGEFTAAEIKQWQEDSKNRKDWRRKLSERGEEFNRQKREFERRQRELDERFSKKFNEIESRIAEQQQKKPKRNWREIDDIDEKLNVFCEGLEDKVNQAVSGNEQFQAELTAKERQKAMREENAKWSNMAIDMMDREGVPDDPNSRKAIKGILALEMGEIDRRDWSPEILKDAVKRSLNIYNEIRDSGREAYLKGKEKDSKLTTSSPGEAPAPKKRKFSPNMTQAERMKILELDPNA
jgi:hypothetical protein